ncbi:hypothetical protein [Rheinheimera nanhaiensis]|uniref:Uncharacterized protein n=1 Tax=Rheinheimera nanhaiensis E407-8 TaxID=562729 RepID=I1E375_9GAMM|nr:hypothetical protein [Rheinheimera nanhaiensis]GAB60753.1 hypothetical protein RNAN_3780 [Rheinheimera nanhaiensis E407-8]
MSKEYIQAVIDLIPELTDFGIGIHKNGRWLSQQEKADEFSKSQDDLLKSADAFNKAVEWLSQVKQIKNINSKRSSYGLKDLAEKKIGYITNGVFIAAAVHSGFKYKIDESSPNALFNMSEKSLKEIEKA